MRIGPERALVLRRVVEGGYRFGSGIHVVDDWVLTANHCVVGGELSVYRDGDWLRAEVLTSLHPGADIALVKAPGLLPATALPLLHLERDSAMNLMDCMALGYPRWKQLDGGQRLLAQVSGWVPVLEGPATAALEVTHGRLASQWAGMSGAGVFWRSGPDDYLVGVLSAHPLSEGDQSLTFTPLSSVAAAINGLEVLSTLGAPDWSQVERAPSPQDPMMDRLRRVASLAREGMINHDAATQLQVRIVVSDFLDGGLDVV